MEGRPYRLKVSPEGVFLVVEDPQVPLEELFDFLKEREIVGYDGAAVRRALSEPGRPIRVAERRPELDRPAEVWVTVSPDKMKAYLEIKPPLGKRWPTFEEVLRELHDSGVLFGIKEEVVREVLEGRMGNRRVLVAEGVEPVHGEDARIVYKVDVFSRGGPKVDEETGRADLRELGRVINVVAGQELAEKIPPVAGRDGRNVMGQELKAIRPKDVRLPAGKNTVQSEDGLKLFAAIDGHVVFQEGRLHVLPVFEVSGDVDYSTGNINFVGSVVVRGSVKPGFEVRAGGDVEVMGVVEEGLIFAEGSVKVRGGVKGGGKARIEAGGDVEVAFLEQAQVDCRGSFLSHGPVMHSQVSAGGWIRCEGKRGMIVGGSLRASEGISCEVLGSEMGTRTVVEVGVDPRLLEELRKLEEAIKEASSRLSEVDRSVAYLKKLEEAGTLDATRRMMLVKLLRAQFQLKAQLEAMERRRAEVEESMARSRADPRVMAREVVHPGVLVTIRGVSYRVTDPIKFVSFRYEGGEVRIGPHS